MGSEPMSQEKYERLAHEGLLRTAVFHLDECQFSHAINACIRAGEMELADEIRGIRDSIATTRAKVMGAARR